MSTMRESISRDREVEWLLSCFGGPFARALAVFLEELAQSGVLSSNPSQSNSPEKNLPASWDQLPEGLRRELEAEIRQNNEHLNSGEIEAMPFTSGSTTVAVANRLRQVAQSKKVSQKELARRLEVSPSVISKVFKNPDRSTVRTLKRIAKALGVELHAII